MPETEGLGPDDLVQAAKVAQQTLRPAIDADWSIKAGDLDWDCRATLDHAINTQIYYSTNLALRSTERLRSVRNGDSNAAIAELVDAIERAAVILARLAAAAPPDARGFHPAGMADPQGFVAMGCDEILIHTHDIASGLRLPYAPPADLCRLVVQRLFPWAPPGSEPWPTLLWLNGRAALPGHDRLEANWYWQCAPLAEWDGTIRRRVAPPA